MQRVIKIACKVGICEHRDGRGQVVREVQNVQEVRAPIAELTCAVIERRTPSKTNKSLAVRRVHGCAEPERPIDIRGNRRRRLQSTVVEVAAAIIWWSTDPHVCFDRFTE